MTPAFGIATGILKNDTLFVFGSGIGMLSVNIPASRKAGHGIDRRIAPSDEIDRAGIFGRRPLP
jgi:hypothetical protein